MPPPSKSEKDIGEKRVVNYTVILLSFFLKKVTYFLQGVGLSVGKEIDVSSSGEWTVAQNEDLDSSAALPEYVWEKMNDEYNKISKYCDPEADAVSLNADGIRPVKPPSVPNFD